MFRVTQGDDFDVQNGGVAGTVLRNVSYYYAFLPPLLTMPKVHVLVIHCIFCGTGRSIGIETDYGLDGPGSNLGGDEIFRPARPALGPTQPPVKLVPGLSRGVNCGRAVLLTTHPLLVLLSWKSRAIPLPNV